MADVKSSVANMQNEISKLEEDILVKKTESQRLRHVLRDYLQTECRWNGAIGGNQVMYNGNYDDIFEEIIFYLGVSNIEFKVIRGDDETRINFVGQIGYVDKVVVAWMTARINDGGEN